MVLLYVFYRLAIHLKLVLYLLILENLFNRYIPNLNRVAISIEDIHVLRYHKISIDTLNMLVTRKYRFMCVTGPDLSGVPLRLHQNVLLSWCKHGNLDKVSLRSVTFHRHGNQHNMWVEAFRGLSPGTQ